MCIHVVAKFELSRLSTDKYENVKPDYFLDFTINNDNNRNR